MHQHARASGTGQVSGLRSDAGDNTREHIAHARRCHAGIALVADVGQRISSHDERARAFNATVPSNFLAISRADWSRLVCIVGGADTQQAPRFTTDAA